MISGYQFEIARRFSQFNSVAKVTRPVIRIAVFSIAVGVAVMLLSISIGVGFQKEIKNKLTQQFGHLVVTSFENSHSYDNDSISLNQVFYPDYSKYPEIEHVQPFANKAGLIRTETDFEGIVYKGVTKGYDLKFLEERLTSGKLPNFTQKLDKETLISENLANKLRLKVGDSFNSFFFMGNEKVKARNFTVSGIYNTGIPDFDDVFVIGDLDHVRRLNKWKGGEVGGFEIILKDFSQLQAFNSEFFYDLGQNLNTVPITESNKMLLDWLKLFDINIITIIGIMMIVALINTCTIILILILQKRGSIGVLRTLGASNFDIKKIFFSQSLLLVFRAIIIGNILALTIMALQFYFHIIPLDPKEYNLSEVPIDFNWMNILFVNLLTVFICLLASILPIQIISKLSPIKVLKMD